MPDVERLKEQLEEMVVKAEARAEVAGTHHELVAQQRHVANRELSKFKFLNEMFTLSENLLNQRKGALLNGETPPEAHVLEGLEGAVVELGRISRQAQDAAIRHDGSQQALQGLEETFKAEQTQTAARARGLTVQGEKVVGMANGEVEAPIEEGEILMASPGAKKVLGILDRPKNSKPDVSAKEPIASP